jgi:hypothetical protein
MTTLKIGLAAGIVASAVLGAATAGVAQPTTSENPQAKAAEHHQRILRRAGNARAQAVPRGISGREQAIRECSAAQQKYTQTTWGDTESNVYRSCMATHGQPE